MKREKSVVYLGYNTFPFGLAEVQRLILISKSLIYAGNQVTVICRNGIHNEDKHPSLKTTGTYENINYIYASGNCFRKKKFLSRRIFEIKGRINEIILLRRMKKQNELDFAILSTRNYSSVLFYYLLSKLLGFKTILNYVEYYSAIKRNRFQIGRRLNDKLFDKYAPLSTHIIFPISEFLVNHIKKVAPQKKYLKIPVLTDFDKYNDVEILQDQKYFLFCGDVAYKEVILFVIDSFTSLKDRSSVSLQLIISGQANGIGEIKEYIKTASQYTQIKLSSNVTEKQLYTYYKNATALLIPLRPTIQDIARFPHKTGEYTASGNPVISTNYGEIKFYFKDVENMLIADSYAVVEFAKKMQFVIDNISKAQEIGLKGKNIALQFFDYKKNSRIIHDFLNSESQLQ